MEIKRLFDFIYNQQATHPLEKSFGGKDENGEWYFYSTDELIKIAERAASGMITDGILPGDKIAIVSYKNRPEWTIMDLAIQFAGGVSVPLYPTISSREYEYILNQAEVKMAFCGGQDLYSKLSAARPNIATLDKIYTFEQVDGKPYWEDIFDEKHLERTEEIRQKTKGDDLATIIYTSGTTGNPKGVMLSHTNITHVVKETAMVLTFDSGESTLSFLPLCHIFERAVSYAYMYKCASTHYTGLDNLGGPDGDLAHVKPVCFSTVPRLLEKVYEAIYNKGLALEGVKKKLFFWALSLTDDFDLYEKRSILSKVKWAVADKLIFSKWREALGGNVKLIVTGAAPCPLKMLKVFNAAGIPVREGYGLTETSPTLTVNTMEKYGACLGTVGQVINGVELYIDASEGDYGEDEGEILARGPNITQGYYKSPEANDKAFKEIDGKKWFRTGDVGKYITKHNHQYLKITDRKKELLKTSGGKYVAPAPIENRIKEDFLVEQIMVVGDRQKYVSALIVPAEPALKDWCKNNGVEWKNLKEVVSNEKVIARYQEILDKCNPEFSHVEQIKNFKVLPITWLPNHPDGAEAELTPTLKLKRRVILKKFEHEIEAMYAE